VSTVSAKSGEVMLIRFFASLHMPETAIWTLQILPVGGWREKPWKGSFEYEVGPK
jgi:hypothetical protein